MRAAEFRYLCEYVESRSGISLGTKEYLVEQRLRAVCRSQGLESIEDLAHRLQTQAQDALGDRVIEVLTTNETSFFRDTHPFEVLASRVLPELMCAARGQPLNIWCAGCAGGQEAYSVAMLVAEQSSKAGPARVRIHASDISPAVIEQARLGLYSNFQLSRGITADRRERHFHGYGKGWRINPEIAAMVEFHVINLIEPLPPLPQMDILLLRNVLIYFSAPIRAQVLEEMYRALRPGGFLFLGVAETNIRMPDRFEKIVDDKTLYFRAIGPEPVSRGKVSSPNTDNPVKRSHNDIVERLKAL